VIHWVDMAAAALLSVLIWVLVSLIGLGKIALLGKLFSLFFGG
jgi:hypothetical protein